MRIPEHIIDQVRTQANIVDVIGEYVPLKRAGRNYLGLCPFHKEKTPSFNVHPERGIYKCFGCGRAGNAITFIEEHLHLTFPEAVRHLAAKQGIVIPDEEEDDPTGMNTRRDAARRAIREACDFFIRTLESSDGAPAKSFFKKRGFTEETIEKFALCAAPAAWDSLLTHLLKNGYTQEHIEDAGLIVVKEDGKMYDRFRGRAMFTIRDDAGRVVGFSARTLTDEPGSPKYINSPQGLLYDKSRILYGLDLAKRSIADQRTAIIVEGQADVLTMHQAGFTSAVASSGTSLTSDQLRLLTRWADTVVLIFDSDTAGEKATTRSIELALAIGFDVRCVVMPTSEDPDSFIRNHGADEMKSMLATASPWLQYQTTKYRSDGAFNDPVKQADAVKTMLSWINGVPDVMRKPFLIRELAELFRLDENFLLRQSADTRSPQQPQALRQVVPPKQSPQKNSDDIGLLPSERELLKIALTEENGLALLIHEYLIEDEWFVSNAGRRIFQRITLAEHEHSDVAQYVVNDQELSAEERAVVADIIATIVKPSDVWKKFDVELPDVNVSRMIEDSIQKLAIHRLTMQIIQMSKDMSSINDLDEYQQFAMELQKLTEKRNELHG